MNTLRTILSLLTSVVEPETIRRRKRAQCQPSGEQLERRALLSELKVGVANLVPPPRDAGALVIHLDQARSFTHQINFENDIKDQINVENDVVQGYSINRPMAVSTASAR